MFIDFTRLVALGCMKLLNSDILFSAMFQAFAEKHVRFLTFFEGAGRQVLQTYQIAIRHDQVDTMEQSRVGDGIQFRAHIQHRSRLREVSTTPTICHIDRDRPTTDRFNNSQQH